MGDLQRLRHQLRHRKVSLNGLSLHVTEAGEVDKPAIVFLHGWPEDASSFAGVMERLCSAFHCVAPDLPGVGGSTGLPENGEKRTLAAVVHGLLGALSLKDVTLVGHDGGGMITYAFLRAFPSVLRRAAILDVVIPGLEPWDEVIRNPHLWHFAFHAIPNLPEILVQDHCREYFDFFYDLLSGSRKVGDAARGRYVEAYARPEALKAGFDWYRAFPEDEKFNRASIGSPMDTPLLYVRGERESGRMEAYLEGFRKAGVRSVEGMLVPDGGHFLPDEQPAALAAVLERFMRTA